MADQPTVTDLRESVAEVAALLAEHGPSGLADASARALQEITDGDAHGARRYLELNRAILDLVFTPANGNATDAAEGGRLTEELHRRHGVAYELATTLLRRGVGP